MTAPSNCKINIICTDNEDPKNVKNLHTFPDASPCQNRNGCKIPPGFSPNMKMGSSNSASYCQRIFIPPFLLTRHFAE